MKYLNLSSKKNKKVNYGLELLRMLMSFWVIMNHCYKTKNYTFYNIFFRHRFHVPTFIIISFYFLYNNLSFKNINKIKFRLEKLFLPYLIYPTIIWFISNLLYFKYNTFKAEYCFKPLIMQFLIGRGIYGVLWFHFNLILLTILFYIISFIFTKHYLFILQILAIISYLMQYSNLNFKFFIQYKDSIKFSVGYFAETFPLAVTGLTLASLNIMQKLEKIRFKIIFFLSIFIFILFKYKIFVIIKGFGKQGLMLNVGSLSFFILFYLLPLENIKNSLIVVFIKYITNYTAGIYFLHIIIYKFLKNYIKLVIQKRILGCIIIYLVCYIICFICYKKLKNNKLKYLFI